MKVINVIGLGYIGLPTSLMFATHGYRVRGVDINEKLVELLKSGGATFEEKGLLDLYKKALTKKISFATEIQSGDTYIIAVPTPYDEESKKIDTKYIKAAVESVLKVCQNNTFLIIESTISPGTIDKHIRPLVSEYEKKRKIRIHISHCPERIIPGNMVYELVHNSRTIGVDRIEVGEEIKILYKSFCQAEMVITSIKVAEITKVVENTFRDVNIAFANELAQIAHSAEIDVYEIIKIANMHPRVKILQPGPGVGGHCLPVDPWFLVGDFPNQTPLIKQARLVNDSMPSYVIERVTEIAFKFDIPFSRIGLYGISYKENVDDYRQSPTLQILNLKNNSFARDVKVFDPFIQKNLFQNQYFDFQNFLDDIDIIVVMQAHNHLLENQDSLKEKIIFDTKATLIKSENIYHF